MKNNIKKLNTKAKFLGGNNFHSLNEEQMDLIIFLKKADKIAEETYGEFGFISCDTTERELILLYHPELIRN